MNTEYKIFTYPSIDSTQDALLWENPDRGFRMETFVNVANRPIPDFPCHEDPTEGLKYWRRFYMSEHPQLAQIYFYLTGYSKGEEIDAAGINRICANFDYARKFKIKLLVRFVYQSHVEKSWGQASQQTIFLHLKQLAPLLTRYVDAIHVVQIGLIGAWGEWHNYTEIYDCADLIREVARITPSSIYLQMRLPVYKNLIEKEDSLYRRLGFHIDSVFGETKPDTGGCDPGTAQWEQLMEETFLVPVDGELFWGATCPWEINGRLVLCQLSDHHFTSFSLHHSYRENQISEEMRQKVLYWSEPSATKKERVYAMRRWQKDQITPEWLKQLRCLVSPGWFLDENGNSVSRSVWEYIRDYLGYKLELRSCAIEVLKGEPRHLSVQLSLVNYGFSAPFYLTAELLLLSMDGYVISQCSLGSTERWYSRKRTDVGAVTPVVHLAEGQLYIPAETNTYQIGLRLQNTAGTCARLGNKIIYKNGCHILAVLENGHLVSTDNL